MAITRRTDYATRLMCELAQLPPGTTLSITDVCEMAEVADKFGSAIIKMLSDAGLIELSGRHDRSLSLAAPAARITMADIVHACEPDFALSRCGSDGETCPRSSACETRAMWACLDSTVDRRLRTLTLADVAQERCTRCWPFRDDPVPCAVRDNERD